MSVYGELDIKAEHSRQFAFKSKRKHVVSSVFCCALGQPSPSPPPTRKHINVYKNLKCL